MVVEQEREEGGRQELIEVQRTMSIQRDEGVVDTRFVRLSLS